MQQHLSINNIFKIEIRLRLIFGSKESSVLHTFDMGMAGVLKGEFGVEIFFGRITRRIINSLDKLRKILRLHVSLLKK
jgi:hypothetical protein